MLLIDPPPKESRIIFRARSRICAASSRHCIAQDLAVNDGESAHSAVTHHRTMTVRIISAPDISIQTAARITEAPGAHRVPVLGAYRRPYSFRPVGVHN